MVPAVVMHMELSVTPVSLPTLAIVHLLAAVALKSRSRMLALPSCRVFDCPATPLIA